MLKTAPGITQLGNGVSPRTWGSLNSKSFHFHLTILPCRKNKGEIQRLGSPLGWVSRAIFSPYWLRSFDQSRTCSQRTPNNELGGSQAALEQWRLNLCKLHGWAHCAVSYRSFSGNPTLKSHLRQASSGRRKTQSSDLNPIYFSLYTES